MILSGREGRKGTVKFPALFYLVDISQEAIEFAKL